MVAASGITKTRVAIYQTVRFLRLDGYLTYFFNMATRQPVTNDVLAEEITRLRQELYNQNTQITNLKAAVPRQATCKMPKFGWGESESWTRFRKQFVAAARVNGFDDEMKRLNLMSALEGDAAFVTEGYDLLTDGRTFDELLDKLEAAFVENHDQRQAIAEFDTAKQKVGEKEKPFAFRLRSIFGKAHPHMAANMARFGYVLNNRFAEGLRDKNLRLQALRYANVKSFDEIISVVGDEKAAYFTHDQVNNRTNLGDEPMDISNISGDGVEVDSINAIHPDYLDIINQMEYQMKTCFNCGSPDHLIRDCGKRLNINQPRRFQASAGNSNQPRRFARERRVDFDTRPQQNSGNRFNERWRDSRSSGAMPRDNNRWRDSRPLGAMPRDRRSHSLPERGRRGWVNQIEEGDSPDHQSEDDHTDFGYAAPTGPDPDIFAHSQDNEKN